MRQKCCQRQVDNLFLQISRISKWALSHFLNFFLIPIMHGPVLWALSLEKPHLGKFHHLVSPYYNELNAFYHRPTRPSPRPGPLLTTAWNEGYPNVPEDFIITEKAPTAKRALTPRSLNVKLGPRHNYHKGQVAIRHYAAQTARPLWPLRRRPNFMLRDRGVNAHLA